MRATTAIEGFVGTPMKRKAALGLLAIPVAFAGYVAFHPGVAFAETPLAKRFAPSAFKQAGNYKMDGAHTSIGFEIDHLGLSRVQGRFDSTEGTLHADPDNLAASNVKFAIRAESVNTVVGPRDADLRSANFFDVKQFPEITFSSTRISKQGNGYLAEGNLSMHGVTRQISIPFKQFGPIVDPWKATRIGIVADPIVINRQDYGMNADVPAVGSEVTVRISLEAVLKK